MRKSAILSILLIVAVLGALSCAPEVTQEEYDRVSSELSAIQGQMATLQDKLAEAEQLQAQNEELNQKYEAIKSDFDALQADYEALSDEYENLNEQYSAVMSQFETVQSVYEELSEQYENMLKEAAEAEAATEFSTEDVEQAIFQLINQERIDNGITELLWGVYLYKWAKDNSRSMATNKRYEYSDYASWQEIHWAVGHSSAEAVANSAMIVWRHSLQYEWNILNNVAIYGGVGVYEDAGIYYITYIASPFR